MVHSRNLCRREDDREEQSCDPSPLIDTSGICDGELSHEEGVRSS